MVVEDGVAVGSAFKSERVSQVWWLSKGQSRMRAEKLVMSSSCDPFDLQQGGTSGENLVNTSFIPYCSVLFSYLAIIEWGWVGYEEFCR